jgi:hypothetical protein
MRTTIPEKIQRIIADLDARGNVPITRLTVLKKWFEHPARLSVFALWVARRAAGRKGKTKGVFGALLDEARTLLGPSSTAEALFFQPNRDAAEHLLDLARHAQSEMENQRWGPVRVIHCWPLLLVEEGLALFLRDEPPPSAGYKLAAVWTQNYDPRYGNGLNGPSRGKLAELVRFLFRVEALEDRL